MSRVAYKWTGSSYASFNGMTPGVKGTLAPWDGFWVSANKAGIELRIPATPAPAEGCDPPAAMAAGASPGLATTSTAEPAEAFLQAGSRTGDRRKPRAPGPQEGWYIRLIAESGERRDDANVFGQLPDSKKGYDSHDLPELDPFGDYLTVIFSHPDWGRRAGNYASDFHRLRGRKTKDKWGFEVRSSEPGAEVTLSWEGAGDKLTHSTLVDREINERVHVVPGGSYRFTMKGSSRSFVWMIR
jgi:hypothetical protein